MGKGGLPSGRPGGRTRDANPGGLGSPRVGARRRPPGDGLRAAGLSGGRPARGSRQGWALPLLSFSPARAPRSGLRAGSVLIPPLRSGSLSEGFLKNSGARRGGHPGLVQAGSPSLSPQLHPAIGGGPPGSLGHRPGALGQRLWLLRSGEVERGVPALPEPLRTAGTARRPRPGSRSGSVAAGGEALSVGRPRPSHTRPLRLGGCGSSVCTIPRALLSFLSCLPANIASQ